MPSVTVDCESISDNQIFLNTDAQGASVRLWLQYTCSDGGSYDSYDVFTVPSPSNYLGILALNSSYCSSAG